MSNLRVSVIKISRFLWISIRISRSSVRDFCYVVSGPSAAIVDSITVHIYTQSCA